MITPGPSGVAEEDWDAFAALAAEGVGQSCAAMAKGERQPVGRSATAEETRANYARVLAGAPTSQQTDVLGRQDWEDPLACGAQIRLMRAITDSEAKGADLVRAQYRYATCTQSCPNDLGRSPPCLGPASLPRGAAI